MSTIEQDLDHFTNYARQQIGLGRQDLSLDQLFDQWRAENPSDEQYAEDVAAVRASLEEFKSGERGTAAGEHSAQLRREFGVSNG